MRKCFLLISLLFTLCVCPCYSQDIEQPADTTSIREYNLLMNARGNEVTAIFMMNTEADGSMVGTIINEFGVKILDFKYTEDKAKVMNVFAPLNKWYIRKVLNKDFTFILSNINSNKDISVKKRRLVIQPNGDIAVYNDRFNISYIFSKLITGNETH